MRSLNVRAFSASSRTQREPAAAQLVGAALGHDVQHRAAAAVLGVEPLREDVELLDRLERKELQQAADGVVVVVAAVDDVADVAAVAAADLRAVLRALRQVGVEAEADAGNRRRQVGELPAVERQALDARDVDDLADGRRGDGHEREFRGHRDRLGQRRDAAG